MDRKIIELTAEFFEKRFPEKNISFEMKCGYFWEWYGRIEGGAPEKYMDVESRQVWESIKEE